MGGSRKTRWLVAALSALATGASAGPASAAIWTELPTDARSTITAIEYQSESRFWFTTANGEIYTRRADLSGFTRTQPVPGIALNDIEFQQGGNIGLAVGAGGTVLRSTDAGATWNSVNTVGSPIYVSNVGDGSGNKCTILTNLGDVNFVRFAGNGRVWIGGPERQIARSAPPAPASVGALGTWTDANRKVPPFPRDNCWIQQQDGFADMFVTPNPDVFYIATGEADEAIYSVNDLRSPPFTRPAEIANGFTLAGTMAGDPDNPDRMWAVSPAPYQNSTTQYTEDGWSTSRWVNLVNQATHPWPNNGPYDIAFKGGTVLAAGNGGFVIHSTDGRDFYWNGAEGALASHDWRAVALASGTHGAVGGAGGRLLVTTQANAIPTPPPVVVTPPVTPPARPPVTPPTTRPPVTRTPSTPRGGGAANPPNVTGNPTTQTTGGARVAYWKRVALSRGRYVPVRISARTPRRFVIEIRRARRPRRRIAMSKARLGRNGRKLVRVPLRANTRTGRYRIVVRVYKGRRAIGRRVDVAFLIVR